MTEQQACTLCGAGGHTAAQCNWNKADGAHVPDAVFEAEFMTWWEEHGQYCRSGGGDHERTFAFQAWRHLYPQLMAARAALAQPSPAPELERPEVVGYCDPNHIQRMRDDQITGFMVHEEKGVYTCEPLMIVDQHDRIVGALRAEVQRWHEASDAAMQLNIASRKELRAAQARVAEIEQALIAAGVHVSDHPAMERVRALLVGAPVAQAGQVPYVPKGEWSFKYHENGSIVICNGSDWTLIEAGKGPIYEQFLYRFCESQMNAAAPAQGGE